MDAVWTADVDGFPIPMRGNELRLNGFPPWVEQVSDPHEG